MTVPATDSRAGPFSGTGVIVPLPFDFKVFAQEDVLVTRTDVDGFESTLVVGVDYTVTLNPDQDADPGGEVTPVVAPTIGELTTLTSGLDYEQPIDLVTGGKFRAQTVEDGFDRATMLIKQLKEQSDRTLHLPISAEADATLPAPEANALLGWNQTADALQNVDPTTLATIVAFGTAVAFTVDGDGVTTDFALPSNPGVLANLDISVGGVDQRAGIDYTWAGGTTLTFTVAPALGTDNIQIKYKQALPQGYSTADQVGYNALQSYAAMTVGNRLRAFVRPQDAGAVPGGVVDATSVLQQCFNSGQPVLIDEVFLTSGNEVPSGTVLVFRGRGQLKLADNSNRPVLQNTNWNKVGWGGAIYGVDRDIYIDGLNIDGNDANQVHHLPSGPYANEFVSGVRFFGVTNLTIKSATIRKARTFGIWCCAIFNGTFHDIRFDQTMTGTPDNQDGLHINGPAIYLDIRNIRGATNDDMVALNADDGPLGANVTAGDIKSAVIDGVYPQGCLNGIRLLSATSRMDQIVVKNVVGSTRDVAVNQSPYGFGAGNVGTLTIENIDVRCSNNYQPTTSYYYAVISLDGIIETVSLTNIKNNRPADDRATLIVAGTAAIGVMSIDGFSVFEGNGSTLTGPLKAIVIYGLIDTLNIRGANYFRDSTLTATGDFLLINAPGHGVSHLNCSDWVVERLGVPIELANGLLGNVTLNNIDDRNGAAGLALLKLASSSGAVTNVSMFNCNTASGRKLIDRAALSTFGARTTVDNAGASGASGSLPGNQALAGAAYTKLNLTTENYDRVGEFDTATQTFTVSQGPGLYVISCSVDLTVPTNPTDVVLALYKGGVFYRPIVGARCIADNTVIGSILVAVAYGDVFDVRVYCSAATTAKANESTIVNYERLK